MCSRADTPPYDEPLEDSVDWAALRRISRARRDREGNPKRSYRGSNRCDVCGGRVSRQDVRMCHACQTSAGVQRARFWSKVEQPTDEGHLSQCWVWTASKDRRGYGRGHWNGEDVAAHRISWMLVNGPVPPAMNVLHHCDNPSCVRPSHLFLGTQADNIRDMMAKGRNGNQTNHATVIERKHGIPPRMGYMEFHADGSRHSEARRGRVVGRETLRRRGVAVEARGAWLAERRRRIEETGE